MINVYNVANHQVKYNTKTLKEYSERKTFSKAKYKKRAMMALYCSPEYDSTSRTSRKLKGFPFIWPGDPGFDPNLPAFELDLEIIKTNILIMIHDDYIKNVTSGALTRFSLICPGDLVFDLK